MSAMHVGRLTVFSSDTGSLAKRYELQDGALKKTASANMGRGRYSVEKFSSVEELATLIEGLTTQQAICASVAVDGSTSGRIVCEAALKANPGAKARTKKAFSPPPAPGLLYIDHDDALSKQDLWGLLLAAVPAFSEAGVLWRPSGSSHVCHGDKDLTGLRGQHLLVLVEDASDAARVTKVLAARLWLMGHGRINLSSSGAMDVRCPVDLRVADAARLIFAAGADCVAPLEQRRGPADILSAGGFIDTRRLVPDLTALELDRYEAAVESAKAAKSPEALAVRAAHRAATISKRLPELMKTGVSAADAEARIGAAVDAAYGGVLLSNFVLTIVRDDGRHEEVTVGEVLKSREKFNGLDVLVPGNEAHRDGAADARLYLLGSSPIVYSLDGDQVFRLRLQAEVLRSAKGSRSELVEALRDLLARQDDCFLTDAGPVVLTDGRMVPLTGQRLQNLVGSRAALMVRGSNGRDVPADLSREVADLVLAALT